jgi:uncharacterized membrane protein YccC
MLWMASLIASVGTLSVLSLGTFVHHAHSVRRAADENSELLHEQLRIQTEAANARRELRDISHQVICEMVKAVER